MSRDFSTVLPPNPSFPSSLVFIPISELTRPSSQRESNLSFHALKGTHFATLLFSNSCRNGGGYPPLTPHDVLTFRPARRFNVFQIYPPSFQIFTDTPTPRPLINSFAINSLRTLFVTTGGCTPSSHSSLLSPSVRRLPRLGRGVSALSFSFLPAWPSLDPTTSQRPRTSETNLPAGRPNR